MTAALRDRALSIGADPRDTADERFRKRLLVGVALVILPFGFVWGCLYWAVGEHGVALTPWAYVTGSAISLVVFARSRDFAFLRTVQLLLILVSPALGMVMLGGLDESSSVILWALFAPLGAVAFDRPGRAWPWFAAFVATMVLALALSEVVRPDGADLPNGFVRTFDVLNIVVVSAVAMLLLVTFARGRDAAQARVEELLLNVLPAEIAQRLQSDRGSIADHFDEASILFADVVDFTPLSSRLGAREVVELLDRLFTSFDELVDRHDVEKIKTIGDCYMVAAGVPRARPGHARALAELALEMRECAKNCLPEGTEHNLRLRIGISSGPVVAGVIGRRRFLYDLWGDTVNMASRMESHGNPDEIQITRSTWELLRDDFVAEPLGLVDVKGKGAVETWRLVGVRGGEAGAHATTPAIPLDHVRKIDSQIVFTVEQRDALRERLLRLAVDGGDRLSDLDLTFGIADRVPVADVLEDWTRTLIDELDAVHLADLARGPTTYRVFLLPEALQFDLSMTPAAQFRPAGPRFRLLFGEVAAGDAEVAKPPVAGDLFGWGVIYALHARASIARGRVWQAEHYIGAVRDHALSLACLRQGLPAVQARGYDDLSADTFARFEGAHVGAVEPDGLRRALAASVLALFREGAEARLPHADTVAQRLAELG